jgi:hypothetical protein
MHTLIQNQNPLAASTSNLFRIRGGFQQEHSQEECGRSGSPFFQKKPPSRAHTLLSYFVSPPTRNQLFFPEIDLKRIQIPLRGETGAPSQLTGEKKNFFKQKGAHLGFAGILNRFQSVLNLLPQPTERLLFFLDKAVWDHFALILIDMALPSIQDMRNRDCSLGLKNQFKENHQNNAIRSHPARFEKLRERHGGSHKRRGKEK